MKPITIPVGKYKLNQVIYPQRAGGEDIVCQVKDGNIEVCHCTWHPNNVYHCQDRKGGSMLPKNCPCFGCRDCLAK